MRKVITLLLVSTLSLTAVSQDYPAQSVNPETLFDELFPQPDDDLNYEDLYETFLLRLSQPFDLNTVTAEELRSLHMLTELQIQELIHHRSQSAFLSVYELQALPSFDDVTVQRIIPFVRVDAGMQQNKLLRRIWYNKNNYLLLRYERTLEQRMGYHHTDSAKRYQGSADKIYTRFRNSKPGDFSMGFTAEKDPGESFRWNHQQYGFDFVSGHVQVQQKGIVKNAILGDFQAQFGQGLVLGGGLGFGKGGETITTLRRSTLGFIPYSSVVESGFFRGIALTLQPLPRWQVNVLGSQLPRDGALQSDSSTTTASSLLMSGLHRTPGEVSKRHTLNERNAALALVYQTTRVQAGMVGHYTHFEVPLLRNPNLYNQFSFSGQQNQNIGGFVNYQLNNFALFAESAYTIGHGTGHVAGVLASLAPAFDVSLLARKYNRNFHSLYGNALSENTLPQNETGFYWGWKYSLSRKASVSGYIDLFQFPWLKFRTYAPTQGNEWLLRWSYKPSRQASFFVQWRQENKARNTSSESTTYQVAMGRKHSLIIHADYGHAPIRFKSRLQYSGYRQLENSKGLALIQDVTWEHMRWTVTARYALFDTDDFDNRQYAYERDVWLAYSLPAYYGTGARTYVMVSRQVTRHITLWLRWARTIYPNQETIGSGGEQIAGNTRNDIKFQLRFTY